MKRQLTKEGRAYVGHVTPILLFYLLLYVLDIDQPSSDNAPWYTLTVLWTSAITCGFISKLLGLPPLVGQLAAGIILANATTGTSNIDLPDDWHSRIRSSVSGLEVSSFFFRVSRACCQSFRSQSNLSVLQPTGARRDTSPIRPGHQP